MPVAAIDAGTNTIRLLIREPDDGRTILRKNFYLFLGSQVERGVLSPDGLSRVRGALEETSLLLRKHRVTEVHAVATAFARKLRDAAPLKALFREIAGAELEVISPETEGAIVLAAVEERFSPGSFCVIDMGGGSTELIFRDTGQIVIRSFDFGSLSLTRTFFAQQVPGRDEEQELTRFVGEKVAALKNALRFRKMFGVGGTVTTVAFLMSGEREYRPELVNGRVISLEALEQFYGQVRRLGQEEILAAYPLEAGREKVLAAGCLALMGVMNCLEIGAITASDTSLLDGIISYSRKTASSR